MTQLAREAKGRLALSIVIALITGALIASDWPTGAAAAFWRDHSMASGIISGLALFLFAALVIEFWIELRERKKTREVKEVAYKILAHLMRQEGQYVHALTTGEPPFRSPLVPVNLGHLESCIEETVRIRGEGGESDVIGRLCADADWRRTAHLVTRDLRLNLTAAISQWASVMMQTSELTEDFNRVARSIDALQPIQRLLNDRREGTYEGEGDVRGPGWTANLAEDLKEALFLSVLTQESLHREIEDKPEFKSPQRRWLSAEEEKELDRAAGR